MLSLELITRKWSTNFKGQMNCAKYTTWWVIYSKSINAKPTLAIVFSPSPEFVPELSSPVPAPFDQTVLQIKFYQTTNLARLGWTGLCRCICEC